MGQKSCYIYELSNSERATAGEHSRMDAHLDRCTLFVVYPASHKSVIGNAAVRAQKLALGFILAFTAALKNEVMPKT